MRPRVPGMTEADDAILELLQELGTPGGKRIALPPSPIWRHLVVELETIDKSPSTISRRLKTLSERKLVNVRKEDGAYYALSGKGDRYLTGDIEKSELELPNE